MNNGGYKTVHECEEAGRRHVVLHNLQTGGVIVVDSPLPRVYCCCLLEHQHGQ